MALASAAGGDGDGLEPADGACLGHDRETEARYRIPVPESTGQSRAQVIPVGGGNELQEAPSFKVTGSQSQKILEQGIRAREDQIRVHVSHGQSR